ncbi:SusC/RagA family TonB-linked outer membrane protein [Chitinophaga arvensicola]|uniref:TonB-linked outer membrane protein, SusC/RagA family n=1 Tax=Chitinophaga arvensicola TaxID=29529 RepID=A0A1I0S4K5_9BACT|nr:TonB-dependent receptor [Chitinophaga arvensicola]SEW49725.1 TonB-linked outer membrane protein, SusC/RagA family [Chitinophaga arvensicola]
MKRLLLLMLLASGLLQAYAQKQLTKGKVLDETGQPLPGATVRVKGTNISSPTNATGEFQIATGDAASPVLVISYIGYISQEVAVTGDNLNITLKTDSRSLNDVVVVGYGTQKKSDVTGATSSVKAVEIAKRPLARVEQALQGTTSGVTVQSNSGQPGKGISVRIRGASSITGGNDPLYVIDGYIGGNLESIAPGDIESLEILKDASATAIYGSRGANGVVMVTTKTGKTGKPRVDASGWISKASLPRRMGVLNAYDFALQRTKKDIATGTGRGFTDAQLAALKQNPDGTDWQSELTQKPIVQNYQVGVSGGSENVKYYFSYNYLNQPGLLINSGYNRHTLRANVDVKLNSKMDLKVNITGLLPSSHNTDFSGDITDPFAQSTMYDPTSSVRDALGNYIPRAQFASLATNPVQNIMTRSVDGKTSNMTATGVFTYRIIDHLTFTSNNSYELQNQQTQSVFPPGTNEGYNGGDYAKMENSRYRSWQNSNFLTYNNRFGKHSLTVTALFEQASKTNTNTIAQANKLSTYSLGYWNLALGKSQSTSGGFWEDALISYMGRVNYAFNDKYLLTVAVRTDGSSHLVDKYSTFPSVALGWAIDKEGFMAGSKTVTGLKLRASYGQTGNQAVPAYSSIAQVSTGLPYYFDGTTPSVNTPLGSPVSKSLRWEKNTTYDLGLDMEFWNGRLTFTADAYNKKVTDLLYNTDNPFYYGGGSYQRNIGSVRNTGLEFAVGGIPVVTKDFKWNSSFNISFNKNEVLDLGGQDNIIVNGIGSAQQGVSIIKVGQPLGTFYGYRYLGTWKTEEKAEAATYGKKPGDTKYADLDGDKKLSGGDLTTIGNGMPKYYFGFINDFSYKNWSMNVMFQGTHGNQIYSFSQAYTMGGLGDARDATNSKILEMWTPEKQTDVPTYGNQNEIKSSRYVYDASYIKLKNISLTYTIPTSLLSRIHARSLDVYISAQNIWTITNFPGYDPEVTNATNAITQGLETGTIPNPKTYTIGLRLGL